MEKNQVSQLIALYGGSTHSLRIWIFLKHPFVWHRPKTL